MSAYLERILPFAPGSNDTLEQSQWGEKKWVWVADREEGYLPAAVVAEAAGDSVTVELPNGVVGVTPPARPLPLPACFAKG